jgi:hypothetical protein
MAGRKKTNRLTHIGGTFEPALATAFYNLALSKGISMREALRRVITQTIIDGSIPGIAEVNLNVEHLERDRWAGGPVRTFKGESTATTTEAPSTTKKPLPAVE